MRAWPPGAVALLTGGLVCLAAGTPAPLELGLSGNESRLWMHQERIATADSQHVLTFGVRPARQSNFLFPAALRNLRGRVQLTADLGDDLHVFFSEGTHRRYHFRLNRRIEFARNTELSLPDQRLPLAVCGDAPNHRLYAVVPADCLAALPSPPLEPDSEALDTVDVGTAPAVAAPAEPGRFALVRYEGQRWWGEQQIPEWVAAPAAIRLAVDPAGQVHLWASAGAGGTWLHTRRTDDNWSAPQALPDAVTEVLCCFVHERRMAVVAVLGEGSGHSLAPLTYDGGAWIRGPVFELDGAAFRVSDLHPVAARFRQSIAVAYRNAQDQVLVGRWPLTGGAALEPPTLVGHGRLDNAPLRNWQSQSVLGFVLMGLLLAYVFWRRQAVITRALPLPAHYVVAGLGRRALAFLIDFLPVALVTAWSWFPALVAWLDDYQRQQLEGEGPPPLSMDLLWSWVLCCGLYIIYATVTETMYGGTPGKLVLQCRVVTEAGRRCSLRQIIIRNGVRAIELFPMFQLWFAVIPLVLTRNRQRLGDLMAGTLVVERVHPARRRTQLREPGPDAGAPPRSTVDDDSGDSQEPPPRDDPPLAGDRSWRRAWPRVPAARAWNPSSRPAPGRSARHRVRRAQSGARRLLAMTLAAPAAAVAGEDGGLPGVERLPVSFSTPEGWTYRGGIELPPRHIRRPYAVLLLGGGLGTDIDWQVPGIMTISGTATRDAAVLSQALLKAGLTVMRWNSIREGDPLHAQDPLMFDAQPYPKTVEQTRLALQAFKDKAGLPTEHIFLLGHSNGARRAIILVAEADGNFAGLITLAAAGLLPKPSTAVETIAAEASQTFKVGDADTSGALDRAELDALSKQPAAWAARLATAAIDVNHNGTVDRHELIVFALAAQPEQWKPPEPLGLDAYGYSWGIDVLRRKPIPTLAVVGSLDPRWLLQSYVVTILMSEAKRRDYQWTVYEQLGHNLSPMVPGEVRHETHGVISDARVGPIDEAVVADVVEWINQRIAVLQEAPR